MSHEVEEQQGANADHADHLDSASAYFEEC